MFVSNCAICRMKISRFIKNIEVSELLTKLGITITFTNITLIGDIRVRRKRFELLIKNN